MQTKVMVSKQELEIVSIYQCECWNPESDPNAYLRGGVAE